MGPPLSIVARFVIPGSWSLASRLGLANPSCRFILFSYSLRIVILNDNVMVNHEITIYNDDVITRKRNLLQFLIICDFWGHAPRGITSIRTEADTLERKHVYSHTSDHYEAVKASLADGSRSRRAREEAQNERKREREERKKKGSLCRRIKEKARARKASERSPAVPPTIYHKIDRYLETIPVRSASYRFF